MYEREVLIFGRNNSIFDACSDIPVVRSEIKKRRSIKLSERGKSIAVEHGIYEELGLSH